MINYEQIVNQAGKFGKYQLLVVAILLLGGMCDTVTILVIPMMSKDIEFVYKPDNSTVISNEAFCVMYDSNTLHYSDVYDNLYPTDSSFRNWVYDLKIACHPKRAMSIVGTVYFFAAIMANLAYGNLPDRYGRRNIYLTINFISFLSLFQLLFLKSFNQILISAFVNGISSITIPIYTIIINENMDHQYTGFVMGLANAMFPVTGIINALIISYLGDWRIFHIFILLCSFTSNFLGITYLKESPKWLNANHNLQRFKEVMLFIARFNGNKINKKLFDNNSKGNYKPPNNNSSGDGLGYNVESNYVIEKYKTPDEIVQPAEKLLLLDIKKLNTPPNKKKSSIWLNPDSLDDSIKKLFMTEDIYRKRKDYAFNIYDEKVLVGKYRHYIYSVADLLFTKSVSLLTLQNLYLWIANGFSFYGTFLNIGSLSDNIFVNSYISYTAELIAEISSGYFCDYYGRKLSSLVCFGLSFSGCLGYCLVKDYYFNLFFIFVSVFGVASSANLMYTYTNELYPTNIRYLAMNLFFLSNRITASIVPLTLTYTTEINKIIGFLAFFAIIIILFLPESKEYDPGSELKEFEDVVYEKKHKKSFETFGSRSDDLNELVNKSL